MPCARSLFIAIVGCALTACGSAHHDDTNTVIGAAAGGVMGALVDHGASAPFANVGAVTKGLSEEDRRRMEEAEDRAYRGPLGEAVTWRNDASGHSGSITAKSEHKRATGDLCREFQSEVLVGASHKTGYGIACQAADGSWKIVS